MGCLCKMFLPTKWECKTYLGNEKHGATFESKSHWFLNGYWESSLLVVLPRAEPKPVDISERLIMVLLQNVVAGGKLIFVNKKFMQKEVQVWSRIDAWENNRHNISHCFTLLLCYLSIVIFLTLEVFSSRYEV